MFGAVCQMQGNIHKLNNREMQQYGWQDLIFGGLVECAPPSAAPMAPRKRMLQAARQLLHRLAWLCCYEGLTSMRRALAQVCRHGGGGDHDDCDAHRRPARGARRDRAGWPCVLVVVHALRGAGPLGCAGPAARHVYMLWHRHLYMTSSCKAITLFTVSFTCACILTRSTRP